ncbi:methenyltetrahydrofolate synthetase isoform X1 [Leptinotarsa decemlineata]|uniref:methenyltetrahydrofolate synthetase isoform X1 n=2 Tax=Leptinotarsa decemlineata TaxID=7539 RepID=UPI003D30473F
MKRLISKMSAVKLAKAALRKEIEKRLAGLSPEDRNRQSEIIRNKLFALPQFQKSKNVSIFLSLDVEVDTEPIVRKIFEDGKKCFVPRYNKKGMEMVELYSMEDWENLPVTKWNIKQPSFKDERRNALEAGLDLIICPGVAFTVDGKRLGHGGGYYDRFLRHVSETQAVPPSVVAVALKEQIVDDVPTEETDFKIEQVLHA